MHPGQRQERHRHRGDPRGDRAPDSAAARAIATTCARWSSTRSSIRIAASSATCASSTASCRPGTRFMSMAHERVYECTEVGDLRARRCGRREKLEIGDVGYVIANIKSLGEIDVGDTITVGNESRARGAAGLPQSGADGVLRPLSRTKGEYDEPARRAREAQAQRRRAACTSRRARWRSASASAAGSSACCTWRSCRSGWSATTTST